MPSVYRLAVMALECGGVFVRDPWSQRVVLQNQERIPQPVMRGLSARWGDLEALLAEHEPPNPVSIAEQILLKPGADVHR